VIAASNEIYQFNILMSFQTSFVRHDTPHPKELRTRHSKILKKDVDGHVIPHNPDREKGVRIKYCFAYCKLLFSFFYIQEEGTRLYIGTVELISDDILIQNLV
jgi:hypothetical protein